MILSPPFLPARPPVQSDPPDLDVPADPDDDEHDAAYVATSMNGGVPGAGPFPVSFEMNWHGGMHITAPTDPGGVPLKVRAVADGTVVFRRTPKPKTTNPTDPLNYGGGWTDDGCVVIRHDTEIGAAADGTATIVNFYSVYLHLSAIPDEVVEKHRIYRKTEVGTAGSIYGTAHTIHFEIVCDDDNVKRLTARTDTYLSVAQDGRTDAVFGTMWFMLPTSTPFYSSDPTPPPAPNRGGRHGTPPAPAPTPVQVYTNTEVLWVGMRFQNGACLLETRHLDGQPIGVPLREVDYEYELKKRAKTRFPNSPSAGFEVLRFGRVLGTDALVPPNAPHWRQVTYEGGSGWVDLNATSVKKFSDADFPSWDRWWMLIDGGSSGDSRCKDLAIIALLDSDGDLKVSPSEWQSALTKPSVQDRLSHKVCKFPSEWDPTTVQTRYDWLATDLVADKNNVKRPKLDGASYARYKAHVTALCFWQESKIGIGAVHWHFHPGAFITHFRKCGWFSADEFAQLLPRMAAGAKIPWTRTDPRSPGAYERAVRFGQAINLMFRKYNLLSATRQVHFLAQAMAECSFIVTREGGRGNGHDYEAFYGRGIMQTTWPMNFDDYGTFRKLPNIADEDQYQDVEGRITHVSMHIWGPGVPARQWFPRYDPEILADDAMASCDSGGFYWITKGLDSQDRSHGLNRVADHGLTRQAIGDVSILVNGGFNGFAVRQVFAAYMKRFRGDSTETTPRAMITFSFRNTFVPPHATSQQTFTVNYTPQRPD